MDSRKKIDQITSTQGETADFDLQGFQRFLDFIAISRIFRIVFVFYIL